ncbi:MAG: DUF4426 domain-containing protein [Pseudomonadota bacterium]|nr:DUF4426 domain-containing protein [Pseudomonadota bacterium]
MTVIRQSHADEKTVPAELDVQVLDLAGRRVAVAMNEDRENGYVSYWGTYPRRSGDPMTVAISAMPEGSPRRMNLRYRTVRNEY